MAPPVTGIDERFIRSFPASRALFERAEKVCPGGVSQFNRRLFPFPIYIERAEGGRKWTVEGQELIDLFSGHGAILFGHGQPAMEQQIEQVRKGTHFSATSTAEVELAERFCDLVPCADTVRFAGTGSEAVHWALRLARAASDKPRYVRFETHYHGWFDNVVAQNHRFSAGLGIPRNDFAVNLKAGDVDALYAAIRNGDISCVIAEPNGGGNGLAPVTPEWNRQLRKITQETGTILIFDEMVTGFRWAPGGYQELHDIVPDLATFGKACFGGMPGAAVAGRRDLMSLADPARASQVAQYGTWNAFPVAMVSGVEVCRRLEGGELNRQLNAKGDRLRLLLRDKLVKTGVSGDIIGEASQLHVRLAAAPGFEGNWFHQMRCALILRGVDTGNFGGYLMFAHTDADLDLIANAFEGALGELRDEGVVLKS